MRYRLKYQTRGKVESYIALTTSYIASLANTLYAENELDGLLLNISDELTSIVESSEKGLTANPSCEIENNALSVRNTAGREILLVYFDRVYESGTGPQVKRL